IHETSISTSLIYGHRRTSTPISHACAGQEALVQKSDAALLHPMQKNRTQLPSAHIQQKGHPRYQSTNPRLSLLFSGPVGTFHKVRDAFLAPPTKSHKDH